jgi:hypothetical protein
VAPLAIVLDSAAGGGRAVARQVRAAARQTLGDYRHSAFPRLTSLSSMQLVLDLARAAAAQRSAARAVVVAALDQPAHAFAGDAVAALRVLDCHADPFGWQGGACAVLADGGLDVLEAGLLRDGGASGAAGPAAVVVDGLSALADAHGAAAVAALLARLRRDARVAAVAGRLHANLHAAREVAALCAGASATLEVGPCTDAAAAGAAFAPDGAVTANIRRRMGRIKLEAQLFRLAGGGVELCAAAAGAALGGTAAAAAPPPAAPAAPPMPGGMRAELTAAERAARAGVRLPFERAGGGAAAAADWRAALPADAGGTAPRLGHISYVRDSSGSEADSDEDPDDDLDI